MSRKKQPDSDSPTESATESATETADKADKAAAADNDTAGAETETPAEGEGQGTVQAPPPAKRGGSGAGWLGIVLAAVALAGVGMLFVEIRELEENVHASDQETGDRLERLAATLDEESERLQGEIGRHAVRLSDLESLEDDLLARLDDQDETIAHIRELAARDQVGWRVAEARYLLNAGATRLLLARDTRSAVTAFEAADRILAELGDPRLLPLREAIHADVRAMRAVEPVDIEGIMLRLHNLERNIPVLPMADDEDVVTDEMATDLDVPLLDRAIAWLQQLVVVRDRRTVEAPDMPAGTTSLPARETLALSVENARRAALAAEPERYDEALATALALVDGHFDTSASLTRNFREDLERLRDRHVRERLPDIDGTLDLAASLLPRIAARAATAGEDD